MLPSSLIFPRSEFRLPRLTVAGRVESESRESVQIAVAQQSSELGRVAGHAPMLRWPFFPIKCAALSEFSAFRA
jgi:hypothetical protein